jgi:sugar-specific transcriptional regulator TrmB
MEPTAATKVVQNYLQVLGIEPEASLVYLRLAEQGPSSALQLAKATGISRTQVYRRLEELQSAALVSAEQLSYGTLFRALPFENVEGLLAQREAETRSAQASLADMMALMQQLAGSTAPKATVQHYYGLAGLKQANWNLTKASKEFKVFEAAHISQHFDKDDRAFARRHRERCIELGLISYDLTNDSVALAKDIEPFVRSRTHLRHIDPEILAIKFEVYMYNDVVTMLDYSPQQQLAIEMHHPAFHTMMEQLFDAMWRLATPLKIT